MKRFIYGLLAALFLLVPVRGAYAQLVMVDKHYTIKTVDLAHSRLAVKYLDAANEPVKEQLWVDIDGQTQVVSAGRPLAWQNLRSGMEIEVKGGLSPGLHIHAKTIVVVKNKA